MTSNTSAESETTNTGQTARDAGDQATTTQEAERATQQTGRSPQTLLADSAYAAVGSIDRGVSLLRSWRHRARQAPDAAQQRRQQVTGLVDHAGTRAKSLVRPSQLRQRMDGLASDVAGEFDQLAGRGRGVVQSITRDRATRNALAQTSTARSQLKGAATSVRKAVGRSTEAVDTAGEKLARDEGEPASAAHSAGSDTAGGSSQGSGSAASRRSGSKAASSESASSGQQSSGQQSAGSQSSSSDDDPAAS